MFFSSYATSVNVLVPGPGIERSMSQYLIDQLAQRNNIKVESQTQVTSVSGTSWLQTISTSREGELTPRDADALFVMIGAHADTNWLPPTLERDRNGFIRAGRDVSSFPLGRAPLSLETNLPGIFCVGEVRADPVSRPVSKVTKNGATLIERCRRVPL